MGTVAGLLLGAGLLSIWFALVPADPTPRRRPRWQQRFDDALVQAGLATVGPGSLVATCLGGGAVVMVAGVVVTQSPPIAACFAVIAAVLPVALVLARARRRRTRLRAVWPEVIDDLVSAIRAGMALPEALIALGERGPAEIREPFTRFARDYRSSGRFTESLDRLKAHLADPVADRIVEALRLTHEVGGTDLSRLLRTLGRMLREDLRTRGELEARQSWTVNGARLAVAAPWVVLLLLATRAEAAQAYNSAAGVVVLLVGAVGSVVAYWLMLRLGRLPEERRVLR